MEIDRDLDPRLPDIGRLGSDNHCPIAELEFDPTTFGISHDRRLTNRRKKRSDQPRNPRASFLRWYHRFPIWITAFDQPRKQRTSVCFEQNVACSSSNLDTRIAIGNRTLDGLKGFCGNDRRSPYVLESVDGISLASHASQSTPIGRNGRDILTFHLEENPTELIPCAFGIGRKNGSSYHLTKRNRRHFEVRVFDEFTNRWILIWIHQLQMKLGIHTVNVECIGTGFERQQFIAGLAKDISNSLNIQKGLTWRDDLDFFDFKSNPSFLVGCHQHNLAIDRLKLDMAQYILRAPRWNQSCHNQKTAQELFTFAYNLHNVDFRFHRFKTVDLRPYVVAVLSAF